MKRMWSVLVFAIWGIPALAGDWQPNPEIRNDLAVLPEVPAPATQAESLWVDSLVNNLRQGGANPDYVYRFSRSTAVYRVNGEPVDNEVFVYRENPNIFLIIEDTDRPFAKFVVNFETEDISAYQFGRSTFIPVSRSFCVVILDYETSSFAGVPVRGGADNPTFEDKTASWY